MNLYPHLVIAPDFHSENLAKALAGIAEGAPGVRRSRTERHTTHFWFVVDGRRYFVKRYRPPLERNVFTFAARSRAEREFDNSRLALALGLNVVPAIAFGERRQWSIVVDQMIAFEDISPVKSVTQLLERSKDRVEVRREVLPSLARDVARMHDAGYSHLALSPRNYLRVGVDPARFTVIDHNAAIAFDHPIRARDEAVADLLNLFDSRKLFPDAESRREFFAIYSPEDLEFAGRIESVIRSGKGSSSARRAQIVKSLFARKRSLSNAKEHA